MPHGLGPRGTRGGPSGPAPRVEDPGGGGWFPRAPGRGGRRHARGGRRPRPPPPPVRREAVVVSLPAPRPSVQRVPLRATPSRRTQTGGGAGTPASLVAAQGGGPTPAGETL